MKTLPRFSLMLLLALALGVTACGGLSPAAATPTSAAPTRTPRPTFTPLPEFTDTPTAAPTTAATTAPTSAPAATDTIPAAAPTNTTAPKPTQPPRPTNTPPPPAPTKPSFSVLPVNRVRCNDVSVYEVIITLKKGTVPPRPFLGGYVYALLDPSGHQLTNGAGQPLRGVTKPDGSQDNRYVSNCFREGSNASPIPFNGKLEASDAARAGITKMVFVFVRSENDLTPISERYDIDFSRPGEYWLEYGVP